MSVRKPLLHRWRLVVILLTLSLGSVLIWSHRSAAVSQLASKTNGLTAFKTTLQFSKPWEKRWELKEGDTVEIAVGLPSPAALPTHGRVGVRWRLDSPTSSQTSVNWQKTLHALDPDVYQVYRAPIAGTYV
ncbi:MAG TPA: hypothetical protein VFZ34_09280, partial [Blastocatellia bacterium]|nr:hypothetical protein [Blastocatellia bacterium]